MKIQAYAIKESGGKAELFTYQKSLGKIEALIKITHCGLATGDIQMINNEWLDTRYPLIPGHEIVGTVEQIGSEVVGLKIGDRVGVGYQLSACFDCQYCKEDNEQFCPEQKVIGVDLPGGTASHIIVDYRFVFHIPPSMDSAKSVPLLTSGLTIYSAILHADLPEKSRVAVLGIGGLGHLAIQFLNKMGHEVSAFSRGTKKQEMIERFGGKLIDTTTFQSEDYTRKFDFILSTLNVDYELNSYLQMLTPQGKFCIVAQPPDKVRLNMGLLYDQAQRTIFGNYTGSRNTMREMLAFSAKHSIGSIVDVMKLSEINAAIELIKNQNAPLRLVLQNVSGSV